ncbi:hypothetical protein SLS53_004718 [Cytospora paraplurivora]|uniref:Heterokaryon incompatibility domain-containing protein n=1 Tax=Cytospora paraplurivora TaxID=2898453 RepID=A0AAN9YFG1_9PEZI
MVNYNYTYTKFESVHDQIRLLTIRPGSWLETIECSLEIVCLDNNPDYEALSYVWGDDLVRIPIKVDGNRFYITYNLFLALRRLRCQDTYRVMWIDAICINQKDNDEKSVQVSLMKTIYGACTRAILWLGEDRGFHAIHSSSSTSPTASDVLSPESADAKRAFELLRMLSTDQHLDEMDCFSMTRREPGRLVAHPDYESHFVALQDMMNVPWWTRIWVVQETVIPKEATLAYASETYPFSMFQGSDGNFAKHVNGCCFSRDYHAGILINMISQRGPLIKLRQDWARDSVVLMSDLRSTFWSYQATDTRDLFYGLLGLVKYPRTHISEPAVVPTLVPSYEVPESEAIAGACFEDIRQSKTLDILLGFRRRYSMARSFHWPPPQMPPSWVPDMHATGRVDPMRMAQIQRNRYLRRRYFCAAPPELQYDVQLTSKTLLRVRSRLVSPILEVGDQVSMSSTEIRPWSAICQWMNMVGITDWPDLAPERGSLKDSFWRALIHDGADLPLMLTDGYGQAKEDNYERMRDFLRDVLHNGSKISDWDLPKNFWLMTTCTNNLTESALAVTAEGRLAIVPASSNIGDEIHVLPGTYLLEERQVQRLHLAKK